MAIHMHKKIKITLLIFSLTVIGCFYYISGNNKFYSQTREYIQEFMSENAASRVNRERKFKKSTTYELLGYNSTPQGKEERVKVLIVTYQRSGSTFVSELLKQTGNVFYSMEPLWAIYRKCHRTKVDLSCRNGTHRKSSNSLESVAMTLEILKNLFDCRISSLPDEVLKSFVFFSSSTGSSRLVRMKCFSGSHRNRFHTSCVSYLTRMCENASVILIKTIRIFMDIAADLQRLIPEVKLVHLFRDPRAVLYSRHNIGDLEFSKIGVYSRHLCSRIRQDIRTFRNKSCRGIAIFYDCLVNDPYLITQNIYSFLNFNFTIQTEGWILEHMNSSKKHMRKPMFRVQSSNSIDISLAWRRTMPFSVLKQINQNCGDLASLLGLSVFPSINTLKNLTIPSYTDTEYTKSICTGRIH